MENKHIFYILDNIINANWIKRDTSLIILDEYISDELSWLVSIESIQKNIVESFEWIPVLVINPSYDYNINDDWILFYSKIASIQILEKGYTEIIIYTRNYKQILLMNK